MSLNSLAARAGAQTATGGVVGDRPIEPRYRPPPPPCRTPPGRRPHPPRAQRHALTRRRAWSPRRRRQARPRHLHLSGAQPPWGEHLPVRTVPAQPFQSTPRLGEARPLAVGDPPERDRGCPQRPEPLPPAAD